MGFFWKKTGLSERNPHYLRAQIMRVYLFISVLIFAVPAHLLTKEHPCSLNCIRISDNLKMRLEKLILFAHTDKRTFSDKPTLSACADNVGFSQINQVFLKKQTFYLQRLYVFSEKPALSERNPYYLIE